jgi:hypothetical protein
MNNRQIKKIFKLYGRWFPVSIDFIKPEGTGIEYFSLCGYEKNIPLKKLKKFYPYSIDGMRFHYSIHGLDL